jgi:exosortase
MAHSSAKVVPESTVIWIKNNPLAALLGGVIIATLIYFFGFVPLFSAGTESTAVWAWKAWNSETNYEHARLILPIAAFIIWWERDKLKSAPLGTSAWGWLFIIFGLFLFVAAARTVQGRVAITSVPFLLFGIVLVLWGRSIARVVLFPIAFLLLAVPLNFLAQATTKLQFLETGTATTIANLIGIHVQAIGTVMQAADNSFTFQVDEGCSGIRSLMAITMLSAIYAHFFQNRLWKKLLVFGAAIFFAIAGNAGRLVSICVIARFFGQDLAGGPYHAISGYLSFPFAIGVMLLFGHLLNMKPSQAQDAVTQKEAASYDY